MMSNYGKETLSIRTQIERSKFLEHSSPLYLTSSFVFDDLTDNKGKQLTFSGFPAVMIVKDNNYSMSGIKKAARNGGFFCDVTDQTCPYAIIASATFTKPATLAP